MSHRLEETGPAYALHEYLAEEHHPMLVGAFLDEASAAGLSDLADALPGTTALELLPDEARERARSLDPKAAQQLVDFVQCTAFRRALLVRAEGPGGPPAIASGAGGGATRGAAAAGRSLELDPEAIRSLRIASRLRPQAPYAADARQESFEAGELVVQLVDAAVRRALHELATVAPQPLAFDELARRCVPGTGREREPVRSVLEGEREPAWTSLASELFDLWLATGALDLYGHEPALRSAAGSARSRAPSRDGTRCTGERSPTGSTRRCWLPTRWCGGCSGASTGRAPAGTSGARRARSTRAARPPTRSLEALVSASVDCLVACGLVVGG